MEGGGVNNAPLRSLSDMERNQEETKIIKEISGKEGYTMQGLGYPV